MYKNSIRVYCRLKPSFNDTSPSCINYEIYSSKEDDETIVIRAKPKDEFINHKPEVYTFQFTKIFSENSDQEEVYNTVAKPVIESVLQGYNGTIFAYGQTGSGKTYTISGNFFDESSQGIVHRSLMTIFNVIEKRAKNSCQVDISFLEIYNENGRDLFNQDTDEKIILQEDEDGEIQLKNLSIHNVKNYEEFLTMYRSGENIRNESNTVLNQYSSRSHCILTVYLTVKIPQSSEICKSKLHLIDLAGSERISKTCQKLQPVSSSQTTLVEARHINLSLHYLEQVIIALGEKNRSHIPYRNSMMTTVLRDSLGGNCLTAMIATLATSKFNLEETISTCRFAQRVALVKNDAKLNKFYDSSQFDVIKAEFEKLKSKMTDSSLQKGVMLALKKIDCKNISKQETEEYLLPIISDTSKVTTCFEIFKAVILDIQTKSMKAEKHAYHMYKRIMETRINNGNKKNQKPTKTCSSQKILPGRSIQTRGPLRSSNLYISDIYKSTHSNESYNTSLKHDENSKHSSMNRTKSCIHQNCVSHEIFEEKMNKLENIIQECKKAHEKEFDKLNSLQKLMENNVNFQQNSLTDLNILKTEILKISKSKCENINGENITDFDDDYNINDEDNIILTYDASKKYADNEEEFNDDICNTYSICYDKNDDNYYEEKGKNRNEFYKNGTTKTDDVRKRLITTSEPSIHKRKTLIVNFNNNNNNTDNNTSPEYNKDRTTFSYNPNKHNYYKTKSLQGIPKKTGLIKKKLFPRNDVQKNTWINQSSNSSKNDNKSCENIDISTHYEGNSLMTSNKNNFYDKYNEDEFLKEVQKNAVKSFHDKFGSKSDKLNEKSTTFFDDANNDNDNKYDFSNDYDTCSCHQYEIRPTQKQLQFSNNDDDDNYINDESNENYYKLEEKKSKIIKSKTSRTSFIPIRIPYTIDKSNDEQVEEQENEESEEDYSDKNDETEGIFNFTSDLRNDITEILNSSLTTLNMMSKNIIDEEESNEKMLFQFNRQINTGIDDTMEELQETILLTGDPDVDNEVISFYERQINHY